MPAISTTPAPAPTLPTNSASNPIIAGISFPFRNQGNGIPAPALGFDVIRSALVVLIRTKKRSRVMRPTIGMNLHRLIFENEGPILHSLIIREVLSQISTQLPMVQVTNVIFTEIDKVEQMDVQ